MQYYFTEIENYIMKTQILEYPEDIQDKVIYSLQDGKRLRPILCIIFSGLEKSNLESLDKYKEKKLLHSLEINISNDEKKKIIYNVASFIEHIHCLSLILDDLPEMDNDSIRRGKKSFHSKYNIDYTNFFIYYMFNRLSLSLNSILDTYIDNNININLNPKNRNTLNNNIKFANKIKKLLSANLNILLDGQFNDLRSGGSSSSSSSSSSFLGKQDLENPEHKPREQDLENPARKPRELEGLQPSIFKCEIELILDFLENIELEETTELSQSIINNIELNMKKTSSLFNLSICSGFLLQIWLKKYDLENYKHIYEKLRIWSNILGYMFQISDDILDIDDDAEKHNPNICQIISKDNTSMLLQNGCEWLLENIKLLILECNLDMTMNMNTNTTPNINIKKKIYINLDSIKEIIDKILKRIEIKNL